MDTATGENLFDVIDDAPNTEYKQKLSKKHGKLTEGDEARRKQDLDASLHKHLPEFGGEVELEHGIHVQVGKEALAARDSEVARARARSRARGNGAAGTRTFSLSSQVHYRAFHRRLRHRPRRLRLHEEDERAGIANHNMDKHPVTGIFLQKAVSSTTTTICCFSTTRISTKMGNNDRFFNGEGMRPLGALTEGRTTQRS